MTWLLLVKLSFVICGSSRFSLPLDTTEFMQPGLCLLSSVVYQKGKAELCTKRKEKELGKQTSICQSDSFPVPV